MHDARYLVVPVMASHVAAFATFRCSRLALAGAWATVRTKLKQSNAERELGQTSTVIKDTLSLLSSNTI